MAKEINVIQNPCPPCLEDLNIGIKSKDDLLEEIKDLENMLKKKEMIIREKDAQIKDLLEKLRK